MKCQTLGCDGTVKNKNRLLISGEIYSWIIFVCEDHYKTGSNSKIIFASKAKMKKIK